MNSLYRRLAAGLILGFSVFLILALLGDVRQIGRELQSFAWGLFPVALFAALVNFVLRFIKWNYYLGLIGVQGLPLLESARIFVSGFPLAVTPGKVGEALKGIWLNLVSGTPVARGVTIVLAERISDGLALLALSGFGVLAYPRYWPAFFIVLGGLSAIVVVSQVRPLSLSLLRIAERLPLLGRAAHQFYEFYEGTYSLFRPKALLIALGLGLVAWLAKGLALYLVLIGLGLHGGWETFSISVFVFGFSTVIGAVSALPGGLGATELTLAGMLRLLLDLPPETVAAATLLTRLVTLWFGVGLGLAVWPFARDLLLMGIPPRYGGPKE